MNDLFDLSGKTAVVTGGGGMLGRGFCRALAQYGARVVIVDLHESRAEAAAESVREARACAEVLAVACDVTDTASVEDMVARVVERFGGIDILHNNAATKTSDVEGFFARFEEYDPETWRRVMAVNIDGMFLVAQAVGRRMVARGRGGTIIKTASVYGLVGPDQRVYEGAEYMGMEINTPAVYSASKAAVIGLARHLAAYWAEHGIRVNVLTPGGIESGQNGTFHQRYGARVPLGRMGLESELHGALIYLASDASSYVTGQNVVVDGGLSSW